MSGGRRKQSAATSASSSRSELKAEVPLQALVLGDSFQRQFSPLTQTHPKALLPLVNLPLITYALYFLHRAGVQECFIVVRAFPAALREYCQSLRASLPAMRMTILMVNEKCTSIGDVFRHVHQLEVIRSDPFIVMGADTVADLDLGPIIAAHQKRAAQDPDAIMTMILKPAAPRHRIRSDGDNLMVALAVPSQKVLAYQNPASSRSRLVADVDVMIDNVEVAFRTDLLNTCIYVCSPAVLALFNDQFDLQNIETDFFAQVLGSSILSTSVYAHLVAGQYAARVDCPKTYDAVSRDIIERWAFGFAVDGLGPRSPYTTQRLNIYKEIGSTAAGTATPRIAQSAVIKRNSVIGAGCVIGTRTYLEDTVLDRNVAVGDDVYCTGSYIWSGSTIADRTVLDRAIIARNVQIGSDVNIGRGAIIGEGVHIGRGVQIPPYTKLWVLNQRGPVHDFALGLNRLCIENADGAPSPVDLGQGGIGCVYVPDDDDAADEMADDEEDGLAPNQVDLLRLARRSGNSLAPDRVAIAFRDARLAELDQDDDDDGDNDSLLTFGSDSENEDDDLERDAEAAAWDEERYNAGVLYREIKATIGRCREQNIANKADILLEVANLKIADNASLTTYASCVLLTVFDLIEPAPDASRTPPTSVLKSLSRLLREYNFLLEKYGQGDDHNHVLFIQGLVKACAHDDKPYRSLFPFALKALYQLDAVSGDAILEWSELEDSDPEFVESASELISYLQESDEDTDSDDD